MSFTGFPKETTTFLKQLKKNNNRDWFTKNKARYKDTVEAPAKDFMEDLAQHLSDLTGQPHAGKTFRIYRDVRFSKDKTPYNPHIRMLFHSIDVASTCGDKPVFCFALEPDKIITGAGTGTLEFSKQTLESFRAAIENEKSGKALQKILAKFSKTDGYQIDPPSLKRIPPGYDKHHPRETLLRHKALMLWHQQKIPPQLHTPKLTTHLTKNYKKMHPLHTWLNTL